MQLRVYSKEVYTKGNECAIPTVNIDDHAVAPEWSGSIIPRSQRLTPKIDADDPVSRNDGSGESGQQRDRLQIGPKVIGKRISHLVHNVRPKVAEAQGVTIGCSAHHPTDGDAAVRARRLLAQAAASSARPECGPQCRSGPRCKSHYDSDGARRVDLRRCEL
jgi:hypothetical protein